MRNKLSKKLQKDLEKEVSDLEKSIDAEIKVSVYDIDSKLKAEVNGDKTGWAASIIKVPILAVAGQEVSKGNLELKTNFRVNHKFTLEDSDFISRLLDGSEVNMFSLLYSMIVESDNEAANIIVDNFGVNNVNNAFWKLGLNKTMLGHLLCPNVPRYTSNFNKDGSNITSTNDMVKIMRHIYDGKFSKLDLGSRLLSNVVMSFTRPSFLNEGEFKKRNIKAKVGHLFDIKDGGDIHEVGIIDKHLIVSIMMNKVGQNNGGNFGPYKTDNSLDHLLPNSSSFQEACSLEDLDSSSPFGAYKKIVNIIDKYVD